MQSQQASQVFVNVFFFHFHFILSFSLVCFKFIFLEAAYKTRSRKKTDHHIMRSQLNFPICKNITDLFIQM